MALWGLEFAALWAVLTVFLNFVPYVGSVLGVVLPVLMAVVQFQEPGPVLTLLLALTAVQFAIGNFLDPYVMGNSLNLSPFAILISLAVWAELWGIPGAFLAVPITAILTIVFSEFPATRPLAVLLSKGGEDVSAARRNPGAYSPAIALSHGGPKHATPTLVGPGLSHADENRRPSRHSMANLQVPREPRQPG